MDDKEETQKVSEGKARRTQVVLEKRNGTILGNSFARDFKEKGQASLLGNRVRNSTELAVPVKSVSILLYWNIRVNLLIP